MAILTSFKVSGDPHELLVNGREIFGDRDRDIAVQHGRLTQVIVDEGDGLRLFQLWQSEDGMLRACQLIRSAAKGALRGQQEWRQWDVVHHEIWATPPRDSASRIDREEYHLYPRPKEADHEPESRRDDRLSGPERNRRLC